MPLEFIVPSVQLDESDVGPRPTPQLSLAGIGIVGTFTKGPLNQVVTIGDVQSLVAKFGGYSNATSGYLSAFGALQQGADDLRIVRIAGSGAAVAMLTLKDGQATPADSVIVSALNEGVWGNQIAITITPAGDGNTFAIQLTNGSYAEQFSGLTLSNLTSVRSKWVTLKAAKNATALPKAVVNVPLSGGNDGAPVGDVDYIGKIDAVSGARSGLYALEPEQCGIVLCAQQSSPAIHQALLTFCANCTVDEGLRIAVLNSAAGKSVDQAVLQTAALDSGRGVMAYPWVEADWLPGVFMAPDGYYAGRLASLEPHKSPSNKQINGIVALEQDYSYAQLKKLTQANLSPITLVSGRGYRIRNGVTLASDPAWNQIGIRRQQDKMEMELYRAMQWAISEPHDEPLWQAIATQCDMYLQVQKNLGFIRGFKPTICDKTVNTPEMVTNRILTTILRWLPLYAADFIILRFKREISADNN